MLAPLFARLSLPSLGSIYFSEISFFIDQHAQRRAKRLFRTLSSGSNESLIRYIRSFNLIFYPPRTRTTHYDRLWRKPEGKLDRLAEKFRLEDNYLLKVLELVSYSLVLERLEIRNDNRLFKWTQLSDSIVSLLNAIRCRPSLKSLRLVCFQDVDRSFVIGQGATNRIHELQLHNRDFMPFNPLQQPLFNEPIESLAEIEKIDVFYIRFFVAFSPTSPQLPCQYLPNLGNLSTPLYSGFTLSNIIWKLPSLLPELCIPSKLRTSQHPSLLIPILHTMRYA
ncbi:hypothetical protein CPB84DRAFT_1774311 [Gymnopilus junonius]|uniref:Uncharacterized protein n=1 Tax=Gymnopilus junonius TaxID=109634 RepID=A0A9P5NR17_GYMJU|nr:hypothetical protein CPB84DRAFT_1774311 [Gymnopilus junonius]